MRRILLATSLVALISVALAAPEVQAVRINVTLCNDGEVWLPVIGCFKPGCPAGCTFRVETAAGIETVPVETPVLP